MKRSLQSSMSESLALLRSRAWPKPSFGVDRPHCRRISYRCRIPRSRTVYLSKVFFFQRSGRSMSQGLQVHIVSLHREWHARRALGKDVGRPPLGLPPAANSNDAPVRRGHPESTLFFRPSAPLESPRPLAFLLPVGWRSTLVCCATGCQRQESQQLPEGCVDPGSLATGEQVQL